MSKKTVSIYLYLDKAETKAYKGRLLGAVDEKEFQALIKDIRIASRVSTGESVSVKDIAALDTKIEGLRLVFTLKSKEKKEIPCSETLLISDVIEQLSYYTESDDSIGVLFEDKAAEWMSVQEET